MENYYNERTQCIFIQNVVNPELVIIVHSAWGISQRTLSLKGLRDRGEVFAKTSCCVFRVILWRRLPLFVSVLEGWRKGLIGATVFGQLCFLNSIAIAELSLAPLVGFATTIPEIFVLTSLRNFLSSWVNLWVKWDVRELWALRYVVLIGALRPASSQSYIKKGPKLPLQIPELYIWASRVLSLLSRIIVKSTPVFAGILSRVEWTIISDMLLGGIPLVAPPWTSGAFLI